MKTMDTMCASRNKYRPSLSAASFYQPDIYARPATLRPQSEYRFAGGGSLAARARPGSSRAGSRRARLCSAALAIAALVAALAVLAVAALAFYMGALRPDNAEPIISFECSLRVTRGDVYGGAPGSPAWRERARRYSAALRAVYSAAGPLRAAFTAAHVTGFGDRRLDVYFRLYLDRRKIPSSVANLEEALKDILVQDLQSRRPAFGQIKIDPASIIIKRDLEHTYHSESYMKQAINESMTTDPSNLSQSSSKENPRPGPPRMGVIRKTTIKPSSSTRKRASPSNGDEPEINTENLPVIQGTFQITKTEADITENKQIEGHTKNPDKLTPKTTTTPKSMTTKSPSTTTQRPKPFTIRSTLNVKSRTDASTTKIVDIFSKTQQTTSTTMSVPTTNYTTTTTKPSTTSSVTTNKVSQFLLDLLTKENHSKDLPKLDTLFTVPHVIDEEPWRPITKLPFSYEIENTNNATIIDKPLESPYRPFDPPINKDVEESQVDQHTEDSSIEQEAEDRIGVAEVVEDLASIEGMINNDSLISSDTQNQAFPGIHNSDPNLAADIYIPKPMYTSFTHPTISPTLKDTEMLGSNYPKAHPIPVDIIGSVIENYSPEPSPGGFEDDGKPVMRPPKEKLTSIAINVIHPDIRAEATDLVNADGVTIIKKTNDTDSYEESTEILESRITNEDSDENTERYLRKDGAKKPTVGPSNKLSITTSTPHYKWELINSSTKGNDNFNKNSLDKHFNDTLQAVITTNDAPYPNTTPSFQNRFALLKNITDIIHRFTSGSHEKINQSGKSELKSNHETINDYSVSTTTVSFDSSTAVPPVITLMPAKSNLGINRPLRPRPKIPYYREDERSFSHDSLSSIKTREIGKSEQIITTEFATEQSMTVDETENFTAYVNSSESFIEKRDFNYSIESTSMATEIITSSNTMDTDGVVETIFVTNVTDSIKVVESTTPDAINNQKTQDALRILELNSEYKKQYTPDSNTFFLEQTSNDSVMHIDNENQNMNTNEDGEAQADTIKSDISIPEGTYKIAYHVSGSVSSKKSNRTKSLPTYAVPVDPNIVLDISINQTNQLSADKLRQLANLATISDTFNNSFVQVDSSPEDVISHKAVSSSYTVNHAGFKILTKTYNKVPATKDDEKHFNKFYTDVSYKEEKKPSVPMPEQKDNCNMSSSFRCNSGQCLPVTSKCNRLLDCPGGEDENTCSCADYLRSEFLLSKICDGIVDCWDFSDENTCEWCSPDQFVCANARQCIEKERVCDGTPDCPLADDERTCVTLADNFEDNAVVPYNEEGYLMIRKHGVWGRLCVQNFEKVITKSHSSLKLDDLGRAVCKAMTFEESDWVHETAESREKQVENEERRYWEVWHNTRPRAGETRLSFRNASCSRKRALRVRCSSLDCGLRPFVDTQQARKNRRMWLEEALQGGVCGRRRSVGSPGRWGRIVGGAGATGGAWPWQAALYRDGDFQCGATLIAPDWLLSASHCFYQATEAHWVARLGALRRGAWPRGPWEATAQITAIHLHPRYVPRGFRNDIALLRVPRLRAHARLRPVCLPPPRTEPPRGMLCTVVGWGQLYELGRVFPDTLQEVELPVISTADCKRRTLFLPLYKVTEDMFCAGYERGGRDACLGDSGGPLMCQETDNRWYLHGVTSNGYGCARANRPGVYTKVANYIDWIDSIMQHNEGDEVDDMSYDRHTVSNITDTSDLEAAENQRITRANDTCKGHRCPLGECLPHSSVCNGFLECSDGSDEVDC